MQHCLKFILTILIGLCLISCNKAKFQITNNLDNKIDSLYVDIEINLKFDNYIKLNVSETKSLQIDMDSDYGDGEYYLRYVTENGEYNFKEFGYFTNGSQFEHLIKVDIQKDTIIFESINHY